MLQYVAEAQRGVQSLYEPGGVKAAREDHREDLCKEEQATGKKSERLDRNLEEVK